MATSSFDTTFRINSDWGVKNLEKGIKEYEQKGPLRPEYESLSVCQSTPEMIANTMKANKR